MVMMNWREFRFSVARDFVYYLHAFHSFVLSTICTDTQISSILKKSEQGEQKGRPYTNE